MIKLTESGNILPQEAFERLIKELVDDNDEFLRKIAEVASSMSVSIMLNTSELIKKGHEILNAPIVTQQAEHVKRMKLVDTWINIAASALGPPAQAKTSGPRTNKWKKREKNSLDENFTSNKRLGTRASGNQTPDYEEGEGFLQTVPGRNRRTPRPRNQVLLTLNAQSKKKTSAQCKGQRSLAILKILRT